jgi:hypothetical protein
MSKKMIMVNAHRIAKKIAGAYEDYFIAFKFALKYVWNSVKKYNKKRFGQTAIYNAVYNLTTSYHQKELFHSVNGVPTWFIEENLNQQEAYAVENCSCGSCVVRETQKAEWVEFDTDFGGVRLWVPKSIMIA